ncbi:MAG: ionic transporter y4hA [Gammaproteobacteria bacterium]
MTMPVNPTQHWAWAAPLAAIVLFGAGVALPSHPLLALLLFVGLLGAVIAGVHHAEVVAHRVGEPFGTLILALAITVIEASLIVSLMLAGGEASSELARNTLFATIMIICNGLVGLCLLVGATRYGEQEFRVQGASAAFSVLIALAVMTLVLPVFTTSTPGATFSAPQLVFAGLSSLVLYAMFVFVQTVKHRDYFLPPVVPSGQGAASIEEHAAPPSTRTAAVSFALLLVCLVAVVGIAKLLAPTVERGVVAANAPHTVIGIVIALLVLLPETWAAFRAARADRLQTSFNLAYGSALASISLTIPVVVCVSLLLRLPLVLGVSSKELVLLALTFVVSILTLATGRTNVLQGTVHLVIFAAFLFLSLFP